jgi:hypothetical protein
MHSSLYFEYYFQLLNLNELLFCLFISITCCIFVLCVFACDGVYSNLGMQKHIRLGTNQDSTNLAACLIPLHEVLTKRASPQDAIKSYAANNAVFAKSLQQVNAITGTHMLC